MDISLDYGKMNGIHTAQQIKDKYDIPIVFMSGYFDDITLKDAKKVSSYGFIAKPVNYAELAMVLEDAYNRHLSNMGISQIEKETEICQENLI
jgi:CheY-like chemotaxis protein